MNASKKNMRIEFKFMPGPFRSYYEFGGVREQIRCSGMFCWNFSGQTYQTCASNCPKIYRNGVKIASHSWESVGFWATEKEWTVVDINGQKWQIVETWNANIWSVDWKSVDGKQIMSFRRQRCWRGTAVIRPDWSKNVGLLVGLVIPLCLSTG